MSPVEIQNFINEYGFKDPFTKSEQKELPNIIAQNEKLIGLLAGTLKRIHGREFNGAGLVILTDKRMIFFRKSIIGTVTKEEIPISRISSASYRKGMTSSIAIVTSNNESLVENCRNDFAEKFINLVQAQISGLNETKVTQPAQSAPDRLTKLEKLFEMKQKGILTEDEYLAEKAKILTS